MKSRYIIYGFAFFDGADDILSFSNKKEAIKYAKEIASEWDGVAIWDYKESKVIHVIGDFPLERVFKGY